MDSMNTASSPKKPVPAGPKKPLSAGGGSPAAWGEAAACPGEVFFTRQAQMLKKSVRDQREQAMMVQAAPRTPLVVIQPQLLLHLLMRLLARPARLDRSGQPAPGRGDGMIRQVVSAFSLLPFLADQPDAFAWVAPPARRSGAVPGNPRSGRRRRPETR